MGDDRKKIAAPDRSELPVWIPVPILLAAMIWLAAADLPVIYESRPLLIALNWIFGTTASLVVAVLIGRTYLLRGTPGLLAVGCGALFLGAAAAMGPLLASYGTNAAVSVHNSLAWLAAACHLAGVFFSLRRWPPAMHGFRNLTLTYAVALAVAALVLMLAATGRMPAFFIQGRGGTVLRQAALVSATAMFAFTSAMFRLTHRRSRSGFVRWYGPALLLVAAGLFGMALQSAHGSPLNWAGRISIYLGGIYMLAAAAATLRESRAWLIPIQNGLFELTKQYELVVAGTNASVWDWDVSNRRVAFSPQWKALRGYGRDEIVGPSEQWSDRIHPDDVERVLSAIHAHLGGRTSIFAEEYRVRRKDGSWVWIADRAIALRDAKGRVVRMAGSEVDITERKKAEAALQESRARLALLAEASDRLLRAADPQAAVEDVCTLAMTHLGCDYFCNYLVQTPGIMLRLNACAGIPLRMMDRIRQLDYGAALCGSVARDGLPVIIENVQDSADPLIRLVRSCGVRALCCLPLRSADEVLGTLSFGVTSRQSFTADETALMKSLADQVAVALQRLKTESALSRLNASLMQQVAERTALAEARARQLQVLAVELIEAEEVERRRMAELLHEDLQQMIAAARMQLQAFSRHLPREPVLNQVEDILQAAIDKSRGIAHELSPPVLYQAGLEAGLNWLVRQMAARFGLQVSVETAGARPLESDPLKVFLFRAVQELLFNVVKHAGVSCAQVVLSATSDHHIIHVADQGCGFDPACLDAGGMPAGLGLLSLRERAQYMGGHMDIESAPGLGSRFTVMMPLAFGGK